MRDMLRSIFPLTCDQEFDVYVFWIPNLWGYQLTLWSLVDGRTTTELNVRWTNQCLFCHRVLDLQAMFECARAVENDCFLPGSQSVHRSGQGIVFVKSRCAQQNISVALVLHCARGVYWRIAVRWHLNFWASINKGQYQYQSPSSIGLYWWGPVNSLYGNCQ